MQRYRGIGLPQARPLIVWFTTAWKIEAERSSLGGTFVDQRLDVCFGKNTAAGCNRVDCFVIFRIFIQTGGICLNQGSHLVSKRTGTACADTVHTLVDTTGKIYASSCAACNSMATSVWGVILVMLQLLLPPVRKERSDIWTASVHRIR